MVYNIIYNFVFYKKKVILIKICMKYIFRYLFLILTLALFPLMAYCQDSSNKSMIIHGVVVDSLSKKPIAGAVVSLYSLNDTIHFITDTNGVYNFSVLKKPAFIEAVLLGYRISRINMDKKTNIQVYDTIWMVQRSFELDAAVVTAKVKKVIYRGDTVQFNAAAFKTLPGANAGSLLAKLPGVTIENGVWFQGEMVSGASVDGRKVFGTGDAGLYNLMGNLDAKDVISIEAFKELSEQDKHMGNLSAPKGWIFNFITYSKFTEVTICKTALSYGKDIGSNNKGQHKNRYSSGITLDYFGDKKGIFQSNIIFDNIGSTNQIETSSSNQTNKPGDNKQTLFNISGSVFTGKNKTIEIQPEYSFERKINLSQTHSQQLFFPTEIFNSREVLDSTTLKETTEVHNIGLNFTAKPKKHFISLSTESSFLKGSNSTSLINFSIMDGTMISNIRNNAIIKQSGFQGRYSTKWKWKISQKLSIGTNTSTNISDNSQQDLRKDTTIQNELYSYLNISGPTERNNYQAALTPYMEYELSRYTNFKVQFLYMINNSQSHKIVVDNITGQYDYTQMFDYTDNSKLFTPEISLKNARKQHRLVLGLKNQISTQDYINKINGIDKHNTYFSLLPMFTYDLNGLLNTSSSRLQINYSTSVTIPGSNMLTPTINSGKGAYLTVGNPNLKQAYTHSFSGKLSLMENDLSVNLSLKGSYITNPISMNGFEFFSKDTVLQSYNNFLAKAGSYVSHYSNGNSRYYFMPELEISLPVNFLGSILSSRVLYRYEFMPVLIGNKPVQSRQQSAALAINLKSNFSEYFEFDIKSQSSYSFNRRSTGARDRFFNEQLSINLKAVLFSGRLNISAYSNTYISRNPYYRNTDQTINLLNASFNYQFLKERNASFGISAHDLLNSRNIFNTFTSPQSQTSTWSQVIGRYILFNFRYEFNHKKSGKTDK